WRLLNHPLYGNFRPYHQPFRSMLLAAPACTSALVPDVDMESLNLVEQALAVYESCADRWATPENVPTEMFTDCSFLDCALLQATLDAYCPL
ncbi:MAG: GrdX family protein, partial [Bilophila sp.]